MDRRDSLAGLLAYFAGARVPALAQTKKEPRYIGILGTGSAPSPSQSGPIWKVARELGWVEGQNIRVDRMFGRREQLDQYAQELVRRRVELIVAVGNEATLAAKHATSRIPIVMISSDPVREGLVASLSHPGGNVTGVTEMHEETEAKRVELLRELLPNAKRVAVFAYEQFPYVINESVYRSLGLEPFEVKVADRADLVRAVTHAARQRADALMADGPALPIYEAPEFMRAAIERKMPMIVDDPALVAAGALASLGFDPAEQVRMSWYFIDRILRGSRPADLPVQQPRRFEVAVNVRTASELGVAIPPALLQRANNVFR